MARRGELGLEDPGLLDPIEAVASIGGGGLIGGMAGRGAGKLFTALSRYRPGGVGQAKDAALVSEAIGEAAPLLKPAAPTLEALQQTMRGSTGPAALSRSREQATSGLSQALVTRMRGEGYDEMAAKFGQDFERLMRELADVGKAAYGQGGALRDTAGQLQHLRSREDILGDLEGLLGPKLFERFQTMQREYAGGSELLRLFEPVGQSGNLGALGTKGLNMTELQRRAAESQAALESHLGTAKAAALLKALFRGGTPPITDRQLALSLSRFGGLRLPLGVTRKAGPGRDIWGAELLGTGAGATLGAALSE